MFLSTNGTRIARAERGTSGAWSVEYSLEGRQVSCLAANPRQPHIVYAGTRGDGVFQSEDWGRTWRASGMAGYVVKSIAVSPVQDNLVFAGTKPPALFVSRDSGQTWREVESFRQTRRWWWFTPAEPGAPYIQALALSPAHPDEIAVGIEFGAVLRSKDGGRTWSKHLKGAVRDCHALTYHITDGSYVYEAGGTGAVYSHDAGATWHEPDPTTFIDFLNFVRGGAIRPTASSSSPSRKRLDAMASLISVVVSTWRNALDPAQFGSQRAVDLLSVHSA